MKEPSTHRIFRAWLEDWENEILRKQDCVCEARLLAKYKNLVFNDPDTGSTFTVYDRNMEFHRGKDGGWMVIGVSSEEDVEDEPFALEVICELIAKTGQAEGVKIVVRDAGEEEDEDEDEESGSEDE